MELENTSDKMTATLTGKYGFSRECSWSHDEVYDAALEKASNKLDSFMVESFEMRIVEDVFDENKEEGYEWELELTVR